MSEVRAICEGASIEVEAPFNLKEYCKSVGNGRWQPSKKRWRYPATPFMAGRVIETFKKSKAKIKVNQQFNELYKAYQNIEKSQPLKNSEKLSDIPITKLSAWLHQRQAYHFAYNLRAAMLAMDMGTGKSKVATDLIVNRDHRKVLILCPKSVVDVWPSEFKIHAGIKIEALPLIHPYVKGSVKEKAKAVEKFFETDHIHNKVVIVNYDSAWRPGLGPEYDNNNNRIGDGVLQQAGFDLVILDESHKIKSPGSKISLFCKELGQVAPYKLCLTGTPMPHSPLDVYGQYRFLDPGIFGTNYNRFKNRYAVMGGYQNKQVLGYQNLDELNERFYKIAYRVSKEEALDLPPYIDTQRKAQLSKEEKKVYEQLENDFIAEVEEGEVTVSNALSKLLRLQQVTSGFTVRDDDEKAIHLGETKKNLLSETLEDIRPSENKTVVFARFTKDLENIREVVKNHGLRYGELSGRLNDLTSKAKYPDNVDVLGVQIQSGEAGIDLSKANYGIYYSLGFSLGDYDQSRARLHRPGQENKVTYIHLVIQGTVDTKVMSALSARKKVVQDLLEDYKGEKEEAG